MIGEIKINPTLATYHSPAILSDLRRINFIFGANGTGKTTISRVLAQSDGFHNCQIIWKDANPLQVMVYNKDFVERNFNQDGPLQGVFTLGENQVEAEENIKALRPQLDKVSSDISRVIIQLDGSAEQKGTRQELADLEPALRDKCWKQKQLHDEYFQVAFAGVRNNAERFKEKVLAELASNSAQLLPIQELKKKAETVFSSEVANVAVLANLSACELINSEKNTLLQKAIVGNQDVDIADLINRLGNSDWVKQGRKFHEHDPERCPFCQQSTGHKFAHDLEAFFSEAYDSDIQMLKELSETYKRQSEQLLSTIQRNSELNNPFLKTELFVAEAETLKERLSGNHAKIENKLKEPSRKIELETVEPLISQLQALLNEAHVATVQHNQTVTNIVAERQILISQVWRYLLNELADDLNHYQSEKNRLTRKIQGMEQTLLEKKALLRNLNEQLTELEKQTTSTQPTITAINDLLQKFGFNSFSIGAAGEGRHYRIVRTNGDDASRSLSEGEKTFITFLYFYYLIKGAQSPSGITANRVVVFDDPISSLDSDILYIVSSLIKGVIEETRNRNAQIKQVFVLTHNVYFHKEISFNVNRKAERLLSEESFWLVKKQLQGSVVQRCETNPVRSAYELLWEDVRSENISSVSIQNTLRRILENYFTMWGGMGKDEICALFDGREKQICQSLFSWVNDGSHSIHDDLYINHGDQTNETYLQVFRSVFEKAGQIGHYIMMTGSSEDGLDVASQISSTTVTDTSGAGVLKAE